MEVTSKSGFQYNLQKRKYELNESFYERCWYIVKKEPKNEQELEEAIKLSKLRQNYREFGCIYPKPIQELIEDKIQ